MRPFGYHGAVTAAIQFQNVHKSRGKTPVLTGIDWDLAYGRTTAIVGASGSGKSTFLELINGLLRPERGEIHVLGGAVPSGPRLNAFRRRIGYAVQGSGLFPHLSVADNIGLVAELDGWSQTRIRTRLNELLAQMGLGEEHQNRFPHELSGGQQQRVGICRALMLEPELLLLDEPFSGVDPVNRKDIHDHFRRSVADKTLTVVLVTHDLIEAERLADEIVVLFDGRIAARGSAEDLQSDSSDPYVQRLFAASQV